MKYLGNLWIWLSAGIGLIFYAVPIALIAYLSKLNIPQVPPSKVRQAAAILTLLAFCVYPVGGLYIIFGYLRWRFGSSAQLYLSAFVVSALLNLVAILWWYFAEGPAPSGRSGINRVGRG